MTDAKREKLERQFLAALPETATEAEKAVFVENSFGDRVSLIVSDEDGNTLETVDGIRKRTVENRLAFYANRYPSAHIALYSTSGDMPIYVYR